MTFFLSVYAEQIYYAILTLEPIFNHWNHYSDFAWANFPHIQHEAKPPTRNQPEISKENWSEGWQFLTSRDSTRFSISLSNSRSLPFFQPTSLPVLICLRSGQNPCRATSLHSCEPPLTASRRQRTHMQVMARPREWQSCNWSKRLWSL